MHTKFKKNKPAVNVNKPPVPEGKFSYFYLEIEA